MASTECAGTTRGLANIAGWLELDGGEWDVIHFNFGLHDLKFVDPKTGKNSNDPNHSRQAGLAVYGEQLRAITEALKDSGARLIFATTTPVPSSEVRPLRYPEDVRRYNAMAMDVMAELRVAIDDLYAFIYPRLATTQRPASVRFNEEGSRLLGEEVSHSILRVAGLLPLDHSFH